jgi:uncharacterized repeat protein (TIGR02543 family)
VANFAANAYTVAFDANAPVGATVTGAMDDETGFSYASSKDLTKNAYMCAGYTFSGWNTQSDGQGVTYADGQSVTDLTDVDGGTVTLHAQWTKDPIYVTLTYVPDDAAKGSCSPASESLQGGTDAHGSTATASVGYHLTDWTMGGVTAGTDAKLVPGVVTADATYVANFAANAYTVTFDGNAPAGATVTGTTAGEPMTYGQSKALTTNGFSCAGHTFLGWSTDEAATSATYAGGQSVLNLSTGEDVTLHAIWATNSTITLSYVPDDAAHGSCAPVLETIAQGSTATGSTAAAATGYHLVDWTKGGTQVSTDAAYAPADTSASATYQANFAGNAYTVKFDSNGAPTTMADETGFVYGTEKGLTKSTLTWTGHVFAGWKVGDTSRYVADGATVTDLTTGSATDTTTVTLHAVWFDLPEAAVSYSVAAGVDGATHGSCDPAAETVGGTSVTAPSGSTVTPDAGYHLDATGWTYATAQGKTGTAGSATTLTSAEAAACCTTGTGSSSWYVPRAFTAHVAANTYKVSFDANGGEGTMQAQDMTYDAPTRLAASTLARAGYTFAGWNTAADGSGTAYADGEEVSNLTTADGGTVPLYAQWRQSYVTLEYGTTDGGTTDPELEVLGAATGESLGATAIADTGHHLVGWTWANASGTGDAGTSATLSSAQVAAVAKVGGVYVDTTFTATFVANTYTVTYDAAGGSGTMAPQQMTYGESAKLTANAFTWAGHRFVGWATEAGSITATYVDGALVSDLTAEDGGTVILHAVWADATQSVIDYEAGEGGTVSPISEGVSGTGTASGSTATAAEGYRFVSWKDASGAIVSTDATFVPTRPASGWVDATYTATFEKGDEPITPTTPDAPNGDGTSQSATTHVVPSTSDPTVPVVPVVLMAVGFLATALVVRRRRSE